MPERNVGNVEQLGIRGVDRRELLKLGLLGLGLLFHDSSRAVAEQTDWEDELRRIYSPPDYRAGIERAWSNVDKLLTHPYDGFIVEGQVAAHEKLVSSKVGRYTVVRDREYPKDSTTLNFLRKTFPDARIAPNTLYSVPKPEIRLADYQPVQVGEVVPWGHSETNAHVIGSRQRSTRRILLIDIYPESFPKDISKERIEGENLTESFGEHGIYVLSVLAAAQNNNIGIRGLLNQPMITFYGAGLADGQISNALIAAAFDKATNCTVANLSLNGPVGPLLLEAMGRFKESGLIFGARSPEPVPNDWISTFCDLTVGSSGIGGVVDASYSPDNSSILLYAPGESVPLIGSDGKVVISSGASYAVTYATAMAYYLKNIGATNHEVLLSALVGARKDAEGRSLLDFNGSLTAFRAIRRLAKKNFVYLPTVSR